MLGLTVPVPIACWRKGAARELLESEPLPPPATCYGFLLSLVGEEDRERHRGAAVTAGLLVEPERSLVLRTLWRVKDRKQAPGVGENARPDFQQLLTGARLALWVDRGDERGAPCLEERVAEALAHPERVTRHGGLCLGESTHLIDEIGPLSEATLAGGARTFLVRPRGALTLPVWVDHVGSAGTRYATGALVRLHAPPALEDLPRIPA